MIALRSGKYIVNIILACLAVALEIYYSICGGSCSYLRGDLFSVPLQYIGIGYMACIMLLSIFKRDTLLLILISAGVGVEFYLIGFQVWHNTYCPYCLAFAGVVFMLFVLNFNSRRTRLSAVVMGLSLILFSVFFEGSLTPSYSEEAFFPQFGEGKINVRLYTDYFCPPCRAMEPDLEPLIRELVKKKKINVTFIDTPFYRHSSLYARYYLYAVNEKNDLEHALTVRTALIEAAKQDMGDPANIERFLGEKRIKIKPFDTKDVLEAFAGYLKGDAIDSTPTCVTETAGKREKVSGGSDIIAMLNKLR